MMNKGLTLVELLVSIAIFGVLIVGLIGMFVSAINAQESVLQNQEILNQGSYVMEYMDRSIRMALRDDGTASGSTPGGCTGTANNNYYYDSDEIRFLAYDTVAGAYKCKRFYIEGGIMKEQKSTDTNSSFGTGVAITSSRVLVDSLVFNVSGDSYGTAQPKITILIDMKSNNSRRLNQIPSMIFQTTISQRNLNVSI